MYNHSYNIMGDFFMIKCMQRKSLVIDVRDRKDHIESDKYILNNSINIPLNQLEKKIRKLNVGRNTPIIVFCTSGKMSKVAAIILRNLGYTNVKDIGSYKNLELIEI